MRVKERTCGSGYSIGISGIGFWEAGTPYFLHFETPNPEFSIVPRIGPMDLAPGHREGGLGEGRLCLSFCLSGPDESVNANEEGG